MKAPSVALIDGDDGLGPVVGRRALDKAVRMAKDNGIAYVGCRNSNHFGAIAPYALLACRQEMICIIGTNAFTTMAPWGGREVKIGNNPLGVGAPRRGKPAYILDIAMSVAARGKIRKAHESGEKIPSGWALDPQGKPTADPLEGLKGFVLPIGGHKGYGLALAIAILSGVLTGGSFLTGVKSMLQQADEPQHVSHFFILINPAQVIGIDAYYENMEVFCTLVKNTEPIDPNKPVLLPGEHAAKTYETRITSGIPMARERLQVLENLAQGNPTELALAP